MYTIRHILLYLANMYQKVKSLSPMNGEKLTTATAMSKEYFYGALDKVCLHQMQLGCYEGNCVYRP